MKFCKVLCSLLLVFVFSLGAFSLNAKAVEPSEYLFKQDYNSDSYMISSMWLNTAFCPEMLLTGTKNFTTNTFLEFHMTFAREDGKAIAKEGQSLDIFIENVVSKITFGSTYYLSSQSPCFYEIYLHTKSGTKHITSDDIDIGFGSDTSLNFEATDIQIDEDVVYVELYYKWQMSQFFDYDLGTRDFSMGNVFKSDMFRVTFDSEETGVLKGILAFLKDGFNNIKNWFKELATSILDGIKNLFVPDSQYLLDFKDKWDELLSERFGLLYQVPDIFIESFVDRFSESPEEQKYIQIPDVTIPLPDGESFTFGGYNVKIVPDGFDVLITSLKMVISISCTLIFMNAMKERYERLLGG